jgi:archaellum component FlaF (FlaF/FlaG flagellin family)
MVTVDAGGTLANGNGNTTLSLTGDLILNGTWSNTGTGTSKISMTTVGTIFGSGSMTGSGTSTLEIASNSLIDAAANLTLTNVSILAGKTLSNNGTVTINAFSSGGTFENKSGSTLIFTGANMDAITLTADQCANTVIYSGTDQAVKPVMHCSIIFRGGGTKTISNGTQAHGDVIQEVTVPVTNVNVNSDVVMQIDGGLVVGVGFVNYGDITLGN